MGSKILTRNCDINLQLPFAMLMHRITELFRLEETVKIIESNH